MDERILKVLKEVAKGKTAYTDDNEYCVFCDCSIQYNELHKPDCSFLIANQILFEYYSYLIK
jgi:hypothetical protein